MRGYPKTSTVPLLSYFSYFCRDTMEAMDTKHGSGAESHTLMQALIGLVILLCIFAVLAFLFAPEESEAPSYEEITLSPEEASKAEVRAQLIELALEPQQVANPVTGTGMADDTDVQHTGTEPSSRNTAQPTEDQKEATRAQLRQTKF